MRRKAEYKNADFDLADNNDIYRTGVIGQFNLTFELAWKALQEILKMHGADGAATGSPREILQLGYKLGFVDDATVWLLMLKKRNTSVHIYNEQEVDEMILLIRDSFIPAFCVLEKTLKSKLEVIYAMNENKLKTILQIGETIAVEFKRCSNRIENDVYQSVCSFLNRFGGDIYLGVEDDGTVCGVPEKAVGDMVKNFIKVISNPNMFTPTIYLAPEIIKYEGKTIIRIHIPVSAEVHSFKKEVYDRVDDADVKVTATAQLAMMYIRKQNIFTEKRIYPYISLEDLRLDLLPRIRKMATNNIEGVHSWESMSDEELLRSAGLYGKDRVTGESGYNLAAVMLLGKDDLIMDICPAYETDALVRRVNVDRYDDREIIRTNLIESYDQLMEFGRKHLSDKFFIEGVERKNLRNIITREMIANTLIHREFTSAYTAKFVIEKDKMYTENANRSSGDGIITPDNMEPNPKNPIIASFFRNIGWSDRLGSGVRNIFKYSKYYSGEEPEFIEGDVFRIIVPLNEEYSYDNTKNGDKKTAIKNGDKKTAIKNGDKKISKKTVQNYKKILEFMEEGKEYTIQDFCNLLDLKSSRTKELLKDLTQNIDQIGNNKNRKYKLK